MLKHYFWHFSPDARVVFFATTKALVRQQCDRFKSWFPEVGVEYLVGDEMWDKDSPENIIQDNQVSSQHFGWLPSMLSSRCNFRVRAPDRQKKIQSHMFPNADRINIQLKGTKFLLGSNPGLAPDGPNLESATGLDF